jgi:hypothetical protein
MGLRVSFDTQGTFEIPASQVTIQALICSGHLDIISGIGLVSGVRPSQAGPIVDGYAVDFDTQWAFEMTAMLVTSKP